MAYFDRGSCLSLSLPEELKHDKKRSMPSWGWIGQWGEGGLCLGGPGHEAESSVAGGDFSWSGSAVC